MDALLLSLISLVAVAIAIPWLLILLLPCELFVIGAVTVGHWAWRIFIARLQVYRFKIKVHEQLVAHILLYAQPRKVCACVYEHDGQVHLGAQFSTAKGSWSHRVRGSSFEEARIRLHAKLCRDHVPSDCGLNRACAHQSVCPNLAHRRWGRRANEIVVERFQPLFLALVWIRLCQI